MTEKLIFTLKPLLRTCYVPGAVLGTKDAVIKNLGKTTCKEKTHSA